MEGRIVTGPGPGGAFQPGVVTVRSNHPPPPAALSDPVAKESCMLNLLLSLPEANLLTFLFLLDHLKR